MSPFDLPIPSPVKVHEALHEQVMNTLGLGSLSMNDIGSLNPFGGGSKSNDSGSDRNDPLASLLPNFEISISPMDQGADSASGAAGFGRLNDGGFLNGATLRIDDGPGNFGRNNEAISMPDLRDLFPFPSFGNADSGSEDLANIADKFSGDGANGNIEISLEGDLGPGVTGNGNMEIPAPQRVLAALQQHAEQRASQLSPNNVVKTLDNVASALHLPKPPMPPMPFSL